MADIRTLAEQFLREYKRTPEMGNWDSVIELGRTLAETVLAEPIAPRQAQVGQIIMPTGANAPDKVVGVKPHAAGVINPGVLNEAEKALAPISFNKAVTAICVRTGCTNQAGRLAVQTFLDAAKKAAELVPNNEERQLARDGKFVQAVKALCHRKGCSISDAKAVLTPFK